MNNLLQFITRHGLFLFPIQAGRKRPEITEWETKATQNPDQIKKWSEIFPGCNWGIATGPSNLIVLDSDVKHGVDGHAALAALTASNHDIPPTLTVSTPSGGLHRYYHGQGFNRARFIPGNDIRGKGGYVVGPFSKIGETEYKITRDIPIGEAPHWLTIEASKNEGEKKPDAREALCELDKFENVKRAEEYLKSASPAVQGAGGDETTFKVACRLRDLGISDGLAVDMLLAVWNPTCVPPWTPQEIGQKVRNAYRYSRDAAGNGTPEGKLERIKEAFSPVDVGNVPTENREDDPLSDPEQKEPVSLERAARMFRDIGKTRKPREWVIEGWIPQGGSAPTLFAGDGGTGKSQVALQMGLSIASGEIWAGNPTKKLPVLFVSCEDDDDEIDRRVYDYRAHFPHESDDKLFWSMCRVGKSSVLAIGDRGQVRPGPFYAELDAVLSQMPEGHKVLILDTAADMAAIDENNRQEVNAFVKVVLGRLGMRHHATVILIAHPSKGQGSTFSGSTAWNNAVRNRLFLKYQDPKVKNNYRILSNEKANYSASGGEIILQYDRGAYLPIAPTQLLGLLESAVLDAVTEADAAGNRLSMAKHSPKWIGRQAIYDSRGNPSTPEKIQECAEKMIKDGTIENVCGQKHGNGLRVKRVNSHEESEDFLG